jgi:hypothetical protein
MIEREKMTGGERDLRRKINEAKERNIRKRDFKLLISR